MSYLASSVNTKHLARRTSPQRRGESFYNSCRGNMKLIFLTICTLSLGLASQSIKLHEVKRIYVGEMGKSDEAERFRLLLEEQLCPYRKVRDFGSEICVPKINDDNDRENRIENRQCLESAPERMAQKRWPKPRRFQRSIQPK